MPEKAHCLKKIRKIKKKTLRNYIFFLCVLVLNFCILLPQNMSMGVRHLVSYLYPIYHATGKGVDCLYLTSDVSKCIT